MYGSNAPIIRCRTTINIFFQHSFLFVYVYVCARQVVIEGVRGNGYVGDSAIDDVQLAKGEECLAALKRMMADTVVPGKTPTHTYQ